MWGFRLKHCLQKDADFRIFWMLLVSGITPCWISMALAFQPQGSRADIAAHSLRGEGLPRG